MPICVLRRHGPLGLLLGGAALLYLWDADRSGWANNYYAAAAQAGAQSWKAFFFGSLDAGGAITVDKTPLALWPMALSIRVLGLSPTAVMLPQALEGVAAVGMVYAIVRRMTGSVTAGLFGGAVFALTPVSVLVFRYDNPDALLVLLLLGSLATTQRAIGSQRGGAWMSVTGLLVGLGFLTKMGAALLVVPALAGAYLICATVQVPRRLLHLGVAGLALVGGAGWWVATVTLWPATSRPWIGGSTANSVLELAVGYNGLGRLSGAQGAASPGNGSWQLARAGRVFGLPAAQAALWLVPAALVLAAVALVLVGDDDRFARQRAGLLTSLIWMGTVTATLAGMSGIFHSYYTILIAPATAVLVAVALPILVSRRRTGLARAGLLAAAVLTTGLAVVLSCVGPRSMPWVAAVSVLSLAALSLVTISAPVVRGRHVVASVLTVVVALGAPGAYAVSTAIQPHSGAGPQVGPARVQHDATVPSSTVDSVTVLLAQGGAGYRWVAAVGGARSASAYQLASGSPVIAVGGYKGTDPTPSLAEFERIVADGEVHYFIAGGTSGPAVRSIEAWVRGRFLSQQAGGVTVYDLSTPRPVPARGPVLARLRPPREEPGGVQAGSRDGAPR
ncbi:MAG: glycosyl transferase [Nocardioides sp.]|nr:glycosyl transferase [Nocardioides sp.]